MDNIVQRISYGVLFVVHARELFLWDSALYLRFILSLALSLSLTRPCRIWKEGIESKNIYSGWYVSVCVSVSEWVSVCVVFTTIQSNWTETFGENVCCICVLQSNILFPIHAHSRTLAYLKFTLFFFCLDTIFVEFRIKSLWSSTCKIRKTRNNWVVQSISNEDIVGPWKYSNPFTAKGSWEHYFS